MVSAILIGLFLALTAIGLPVSVAIGMATVVGMLVGGYDPMSIPQKMAASVQSIELMAIPFFILAACLMNAMGITRRIFAFATALVDRCAAGSRRRTWWPGRSSPAFPVRPWPMPPRWARSR
jgi:TRAP-type mannitol/chloroaromatic compound transport system permease large subunit